MQQEEPGAVGATPQERDLAELLAGLEGEDTAPDVLLASLGTGPLEDVLLDLAAVGAAARGR